MIKLTQKQADEIERIKRIGFPIRWKDNGWYIERDEALNGLSFYQYINAVLKDYEVEPEFKVGDWIVHTPMNRIRVISSLTKGNHDTYAGFDNDLIQGVSVEWIRRATPQEIAEEKERRWWTKHDRDVWQLKKKDTLMNVQNRKDLFVISALNGNIITGYSFITGEYEDLSISDAKENFIVFCLAEDRKDA